jgi:hypothetical protein
MKQSSPLIDLQPDHWAIVREILQRNVPHRSMQRFRRSKREPVGIEIGQDSGQ